MADPETVEVVATDHTAGIPDWLNLEGRIALITGAGNQRGIGFAAAVKLGGLGAHVVVTSTTDRILERVAELQALGIAARGLVADLTHPDEARALVAEAARDGLHILVNNAGMTSVSATGDIERGNLADVSYKSWREGVARNLDTTFLATSAAIPHLRAAGWGRVVMVSSVTGPLMAMRDEPVYAAAKAGVVGLMRSVALDNARFGVTCNAVAPGWIATGSQLPHEVGEGVNTPIGRSATPGEIGSVVAWLASPGTAYLTGQVIVVDGGGSIAEERTLA